MERQTLSKTTLIRFIEAVIFFILSWLWASWWMGDIFRIAYEHSFFAPDSTLMLWIQQQPFGWLWIFGRALLTLFRWPIVGGLFVALLLTIGSCLFGYCLRLRYQMRWLQWLPAAAWMVWVSHVGLNLYYMREPGRILAIPFLFVAFFAVIAAIVCWRRRSNNYPITENSTATPKLSKRVLSVVLGLVVIVACFALPVLHINQRHPYFRPLTHMQVQLMQNDFEGMSRTAHEHADMGNRQMAGYYVIALARTGHLADQLFDIKLEFDTIPNYGYIGQPDNCLNYHLIDCNYQAGFIRVARHLAIEELTMEGPSLFTMKSIVKMSLIEGDWAVARKYLHILKKAPFEGEFIHKYEPMVEHPDLVKADPEFAFIIDALPAYHTFEQMHPKPCFIGFYANLRNFHNSEALTRSIMACLYSKRMPDFLARCNKLLGTTPPSSISEGLLTQAYKYPDILQAFPHLEMLMDRYGIFLQQASPYMKDRELGGRALFNQYKGFYPYYYYFGNLRSTRKPGEGEIQHNRAGVN